MGTKKRKPAVAFSANSELSHTQQCVETAARALNRYIEQSDKEAALTDLLTDLMHWSDAHGQDFDASLDSAKRHYAAELAEIEGGVK